MNFREKKRKLKKLSFVFTTKTVVFFFQDGLSSEGKKEFNENITSEVKGKIIVDVVATINNSTSPLRL